MTFSPERLLELAEVVACDMGKDEADAANALRDYAATLRQAARVDEGAPSDWSIAQVVRQMAAKGREGNSLTESFEGRSLLRKAAALEAALSAQPAFSAPTGDAPQPWTADDHERLDAAITNLRERAQPAGRQGECIGEMHENGVNWFGKNPHAFPVGTRFYTHPAAPVGVPDVRVDKQGVRFGDGCWYSHERITGVSADLLNEGKCSITAREYMKWVQKHLAAAPSAPQGVE